MSKFEIVAGVGVPVEDPPPPMPGPTPDPDPYPDPLPDPVPPPGPDLPDPGEIDPPARMARAA